MPRLLAVCFALSVPALATFAQPEVVLWVSPAGNDGWSGTLAAPSAGGQDGPFATVSRARDAIRALKAQGPLPGPVTVLLREGVYAQPETLAFTAQDSGTPQCPITYRSAPGETAWISGGQVIGGWREVAGATPRRWEVQLGRDQMESGYFRQLFVRKEGEPWFTRRFRPMRGMLAVADLTWSPARKSLPHRAAQPDFIFFPGDLERFENLDDVEIVALHSWSASRLKIADLDMERRIVTLTSVPTFKIGAWYKDGRNPYYLENVKDELREPGQWYLDRETGTLGYLPLPGESLDELTFVAPRLERVMTVRGDLNAPEFVEHLAFQGVGFLHSEWPVPTTGYDTSQGQPTLSAAVEVSAGKGIRFERCIVANTGAYGIGLGLGSQECEVLGCLMFDLGGGGVKVGESSMPQQAQFPTLPTGNVVSDNTITDFGLQHFSANGVWCGIVRDTRITHNLVRTGPYSGVAVGWSWNPNPTSCGGNIIERNHIHHVMQMVQDGGCIYTLGRQPGTVIRGNLLHDSMPSPFACGNGCLGLYFDEGSSEFLVEDNIQYNVAWRPERINHNQNKPEDHDIRTNYLNVGPDDPAFPQEIAAQAGVRPEFAWPRADTIAVTPNPVYAMTLRQYPPAPAGFDEGFEEAPVGEMPRRFAASGVTAAATIGVTDELARTGTKCLRIQDRAGLGKTFYPYLNRSGMSVPDGDVEFSFDILQQADSPARLWVELRDYATEQTAEYFAGPSVGFLADGTVRVGKDNIARIPAGQWAHVVIQLTLGPEAAQEWRLTVTLADGAQLSAVAPHSNAKFRTLTGLIMSADADADGVVYLDNLRLKVQ